MTERKCFYELSERQKRRRVNTACEDTFHSIDIAFEQLNKHDCNEEFLDIVRTDSNSDPEVDDFDVARDSNSDKIDYITSVFNELISWCEVDNYDDLLTDDDSTDENEAEDDDIIDKETDIKYRLSSLISVSNYPDIHANALLTILRDAGLSYLPKDIRTLRNTPRKTRITPCPPGDYFHYGLQVALETLLKKYGDEIEKNIKIDINIDGLPITKSPQTSLWPILGRIVHDSHSEVFLIGVYHGKEKPSSQDIYLDPFINEYLKLHKDGFVYKGNKYSVNIRCLICDSPAASYILCIKQFNGYYGCRKCTVKGDWKSRLVFLYEEALLRTDISFRTRTQQEHHNGRSPFERLQFDMVQQVPIDYMHQCCLGITKVLLRLWINPRTNPRLNILQLDNLSNDFIGLSPWIPKEFARKPQTLLELGRWKATTFRLFVLYVGPIILQSTLPKEYMEHFNVLNCALRILCHPTLYLEYNDYAKQLLVYFVRKFKNLYGETWVTWNMHNLVHIADDAKNFGPMDKYSAFPFENYMQTLKRLIRKKAQPLQQIHRRLTEKRDFIQRQNVNVENNLPTMSQRSNKNLPDGCYSCHRSLKFTHFELKDSRPNNCCITSKKEIILIDSICKKEGQDVIVGREFLSKADIPNYPLQSTEIGICEVKNLSEQIIIPVENVSNKLCLFLHQQRSYVLPLLHHD